MFNAHQLFVVLSALLSLGFFLVLALELDLLCFWSDLGMWVLQCSGFCAV